MDTVSIILSNSEFIFTLVSAGVTIIAAILGLYQAIRERKSSEESNEILIAGSSATLQSEAKEKSLQERQSEHLNRRMSEVNETITSLSREVRITSLSNNLLVAGQYVVGGTLATSFLQESLSSTTVGVLGLVVLVATIVHQRYRPDLRARVAKSKLALLRATVRKSQDNIVRLDQPEYIKLIGELTKALNQIENEEKWQIEEAPQRTDQMREESSG
jgi:hypothetical protein